MTVAEARPRIEVLAPEIVDRIAAGEVVERPASVVRELLDNSLDAGAERIQIELRGAGLDLIRVADDGHGIEADQLEAAFERHATSKVRRLDDLASLATFGFRGEALPSIAAVAEVEIASAVAGSDGHRARFRGGSLLEEGRIARERGTTIWVRDLFGNVPARRRFLAEPRAELARVIRHVRWCGVANPHVRLELLVDGSRRFSTSGSNRVDLALAEAQGDGVLARLARLGSWEIGQYRVEGLLTVGGLTRPSRQHLAVFVNRRRVRVPAVEAALESAYGGLLPAGRHPVGAILISAPSEAVDVNVHPSKEQVRLRDEQALVVELAQRLRALFSAQPGEPGQLERFVLQPPDLAPRRVAEGGRLWGDEDDRAPALPRYLGQLHGSLLICESRGGLILVDQHRAEERVLFDRLKRAGAAPPAQGLLEPIVVTVPAGQVAVIEARLAELSALGFDYERFGATAFRLRSAPVLTERADLLTSASDALTLAGEQDEFWRDRLLATVACRSAIRKGQAISPARAAHLVDDLFHCLEPTVCPHGSPVVMQLSRQLLRRQFRW